MNRYVARAAGVRAVAFTGATVLVDIRSGRVRVLLDHARTLWDQLARTGDVDQALRFTDREAGDELLDQLVEDGFLTPARTPRPWPAPVKGRESEPSWGTQVGAVALSPMSVSHPWAAAAGLIITLVAERLGRRHARLNRIITLVRLTAPLGRRSATALEAEAAAHAVRALGRLLPVRTACLEHSAATALALVLRGRSVNWCHGIAPDPVRLHAWVETEDQQPAAEPPSTALYTTVHRIHRRRR